MTTSTPKISIFDSKESYLAFKRAWAAAVTSKEAKSTLEPPTEYTSDGKPIKVSGRHRYHGWIWSYHHMMYNIVRGHDKYRGFDLNEKHKATIIATEKQLADVIKYAQEHDKPDYPTSYKSRFVDSFLSPFAGTLTARELAKLTVV